MRPALSVSHIDIQTTSNPQTRWTDRARARGNGLQAVYPPMAQPPILPVTLTSQFPGNSRHWTKQHHQRGPASMASFEQQCPVHQNTGQEVLTESPPPEFPTLCVGSATHEEVPANPAYTSELRPACPFPPPRKRKGEKGPGQGAAALIPSPRKTFHLHCTVYPQRPIRRRAFMILCRSLHTSL